MCVSIHVISPSLCALVCVHVCISLPYLTSQEGLWCQPNLSGQLWGAFKARDLLCSMFVKGHSINTTQTAALKVIGDVCTYLLALLLSHRTGMSHTGATPATLVPDCEKTRSRGRAFTDVAADMI